MNDFDQILSGKTIKDLQLIRDSFQSKKPFKSVVIDNFFDARFVKKLIEEFPEPSPIEMINEYGDPSKKHVVRNVKNIGLTYRLLDKFISSSNFLNIMESIVNIEGLIYDPTYYGGGDSQ